MTHSRFEPHLLQNEAWRTASRPSVEHAPRGLARQKSQKYQGRQSQLQPLISLLSAIHIIHYHSHPIESNMFADEVKSKWLSRVNIKRIPKDHTFLPSATHVSAPVSSAQRQGRRENAHTRRYKAMAKTHLSDFWILKFDHWKKRWNQQMHHWNLTSEQVWV